ncbi:amino acid adenylation domain-containing protein [Dactylosporangium roseum]|uniref:Phenyloxazoline synthase MbtB n=1 Tax=Dactylosporangium roseum TaxID=47989 RepID=A0ABY5Z2K9_9ACTN|nr:non-ribosomal peptide synthetase [Dactylosporangium roseum]UWZ34709.1 amino acid adenylation domain-containing protein [Dactylosporangium roseum]
MNGADLDALAAELGALLDEITGDARGRGADEPLMLQSLTAVEFRSGIQARLGVDLPLDLFFGDCTLRVLAGAARTRPARRQPESALLPDPCARHEPFDLTDVQQAYLLGRDAVYLGGRSTHVYLEIDLLAVSLENAEKAFNTLITENDMLRAVIVPGGRQRVLPEVPYYRIAHEDLGDHDEARSAARLAAVRAELDHQAFDPHRWPLYEVRATTVPGDRLRLHISVDLLFLDAASLRMLIAEWIRRSLGTPGSPPASELTFRDYVLALGRFRQGAEYAAARAYWSDRLTTLPAAPDLPVTAEPSGGPARFTRRDTRLDAATTRDLFTRAEELGVTPAVLLGTLFADVLAAWSRSAHFSLNVTLADRPWWHPGLPRLIGDFTSTILLECDLRSAAGLPVRARAFQRRLHEDLVHATFSGVRVQRELAKRGGPRQPWMPVVFTCLLEEQDDLGELDGIVYELGYGLSQTPQVYLDNQVLLHGGELIVNWDAVDAIFPGTVLADMFDAYADALRRVAAGATDHRVAVPPAQLAVRERVNDTAAPFPDELLHAGVDRMVRARPDAPAVITATRTLTYRELDDRAQHLAGQLRELGVRPNTLVGVHMHKGWEQVVAVLGVLRSGAAYLPIDTDLPELRVAQLCAAGRLSVVVTQSTVTPPDGVTALVVADEPPTDPARPVPAVATTPADLAYVIFTSGSTGQPKGVSISHRSAVNTVDDVATRWSFGPQDRILALSSLSFDLSVFDVFGVLGTGGAVVVPDPDVARDPERWLRLAREHRVTAWNSVPALLELLVEYCERFGAALPPTLRLALLSGDWIPTALPARVRAVQARPVRLISLGGATEAAIWSIWHPMDDLEPGAPSVPYGRPLRNQSWHVFDEKLQPRPDWVPGELYIGGAGVADGYWGAPETTALRFVRRPVSGERLYRTGDFGRYRPDGVIEFLGREDTQVKLGGYRIELGEIEAVLLDHPGVRAAVCVVSGDPRQLVAYAVPRPEAGGLTEDDVRGHLARRLPAYMRPAVVVLLDDLPLTRNGKVDRSRLPEPGLAGGFEPPATAAEVTLAAVWTRILGVERVGRRDDFFALGGDSLLVVRLVAKAAENGLHLKIRDCFEQHTLAAQAAAAGAVAAGDAEQAMITGRVELTPSQRWFMAQEFADPQHWNGMWPLFELDRPLRPDLLADAFRAVLRHHDNLRARYHRDGAGWHAWIDGEAAVEAAEVEVVDLSGTADADLEEHLDRLVARCHGSLDLDAGPVVRLAYVDLGPGRPSRLLVSAHWLVLDYYSSRIFYEDLRAAYFALERGDAVELPPKTVSVRAAVARLDRYARSAELAAELPFWTALARRAPAPLPVDRRRGPDVQAAARRLVQAVDGPLATLVCRDLPAAYSIEPRETLLAALSRTIYWWTGHPQTLIEVEGLGRDEVFGGLDVSRTVARFSTLVPVLLDGDGDLHDIRAQIRAVPQRGAGYGLLRYQHPDAGVRAALEMPAPELGFNYWGDVSEYFTADANPTVQAFGHHRGDRNRRPRPLDLMAMSLRGGLQLVWNYSTRLHADSTIAALAERYVAELEHLVKEVRPDHT